MLRVAILSSGPPRVSSGLRGPKLYVSSLQRVNRVRLILIFLYSGTWIILFNGPPKPWAWWSGRSQDKCEQLILTMVAHRDLNSNPDSCVWQAQCFHP